ncbi:BA75_01497T0 [Komagataella pastoris]|uniref:BA75_01497T0 n=1 Tax=Komagataella pastoris TaxID=4922 RepID=A0A1B2J7G5_PICPA|nr:BA75_01497T0 [Komagataella pastoris]
MSEEYSIYEHLKPELFQDSDGNVVKYSDRVALPPSILESLVNQQQRLSITSLPHPLIFRLQIESPNPEAYCFVGVKEFTSQEGIMLLPQFIVDKLVPSGNKDCTISITLANDVPKGTSIALKPLEMYPEIKDWKYFLEAKLIKSYTTLSTNDTICISERDKVYKLLVEQAEPSSTICLIDTDIDLSIVPLDDEMAKEMNNQQDTETVLQYGTNDVIIRDTKHSHVYKLQLDKGDDLYLSLSIDSQDVNLVDLLISINQFISTDSFQLSTIPFNEDPNVSKSNGIISIRIPKADHWIEGEEFLYILPIMWSEGQSFKSQLSISKLAGEHVVSTNSPQETLNSEEVKCSNCGKHVSKQSILLHENFCHRNNIKCSCGQLFLKKIPDPHWHCQNDAYFGETIEGRDIHQQLHHTKHECSLCSATLPNYIQLALHKSTECPERLHICRYCQLTVPQEEPSAEAMLSSMTQHEYQCGSKTTECPECSKIVRQRDLRTHMQLHELDRKQQVAPTVCANVNCCRILNEPTDLQLCSVCFGPLYSTDYDPNYIKLKNRLERKYILQLTRGCGTSWCKNVECISSGINPSLRSTPLKEKIKHISNDLLTLVPLINQNVVTAEYFLCVDNLVTKRKFMADMIYEQGQYEYGWICEAVGKLSFDENGSEMGQISNMEQWLHKHAVKVGE